MATTAASATSTLRSFVFERVLNQDTRSKTINLLGRIEDSPAILIAEKTAFDASADSLSSLTSPATLPSVALLDKNDIYHWFLASSSGSSAADASSSSGASASASAAGVKLTLIHPATPTHITKYSQQTVRMVVETPSVYASHVAPFIRAKRSDGRLNWVYNILSHAAEADRIIYEDADPATGFILLPDLKWDRKTLSALYVMALVHRRDVASLRDLTKKDAPWLRGLQEKILDAVCERWPQVERDQVKCYVHYQPSYYHFHVHAVSVAHDGGMGQAAGKACLLRNVIGQLESMQGGEDAGFKDLELEYVLGEESELYQGVFKVLNAGEIQPRTVH